MKRLPKDISEQGLTPIESTCSTRLWPAWLLGREPQLAARFAHYFARLTALPRAQRRRIARRVAGALAGAALLLALSGARVGAATITVAAGQVAIQDDGLCSLVEAIANANDTSDGQPHDDCAAGDPAGPDTISLASGSLFAVEWVDNELYGYTGLPAIESSVTIMGNEATIRRAGAEQFRLLAVSSSGDLTLENVKIEAGSLEYAYGGAILAYGNLTVRDSTLSGNAAYAGGAIFAYEVDVHISGSRIENNQAYSGGGLSFQNTTATIEDTIISGAKGPAGWGGGGAYFLESEVEITGSTLTGNSNDGGGGGIKSTYTTLMVRESVLADNDGAKGYGGGLYVYHGQVTVINTTISGNSAASGGGVYQYEGATDIRQSLVAQNQATMGGGVMNGKGTMGIANSTLSGNAADAGGGVVNQSVMTVENATLTANTAAKGDGGGFLNRGPAAEATVRRSLIAGNSASGQGREMFHDGKAIAAGYYNLVGASGNSGVAGFTPGGTSFTPSIPLSDVIVPTLADNGGPTRSHLPAAGSPAIDRAPSADCQALPVGGVDQRGDPRNQDADLAASEAECDIGAVEAAGTIQAAWEIFIPAINRQ